VTEAASEPGTAHDGGRALSALRRRWRSPWLLLGVMIAVFAGVSFYAGTISFYDFQTRNATDLGIFMQALTSTVRGQPAPFYESYDCMVKARCSFLLVHASPAIYGAVPFYAVAPSPLTLFALQSVGVGAAAVPLYILTRRVTGSPGKGLIASGLYLVWAPTLGGEAFSFHLESFLPLALFTVMMFWVLGQYRWGLLAALASFLVLEIAPVFAFLIGAFFLTFAVQRIVARVGERPPEGAAPPVRGPGRMRTFLSAVRAELARRDIRYTLVLMGSSIVAYVLLFLFMNVWGARLLGVPPPPLAPGLSGIFYDNSSPTAQPLGVVLRSSQLFATLEFWAILYALVGFVPFLAPRTYIISLPWIGWTILTDTTRYVQIGSQYTLVAAVPVFLGLAYGLVRTPGLAAPARTPEPTPIRPAPTSARARRKRSRLGRGIWAGVLVAVIALNAVLLPIDPLLGNAGVNLGEPFQPGYQDHSLTVVPGFSWAEDLVDEVPRPATVTAPSQIFPLVANYPHAFVMLAGGLESDWRALPYNLTVGPDDVILFPSFLHLLSQNFSSNLSSTADYRIEGWVGSTTVGPLLLYARGYAGAATLFGPTIPDALTWFPGPGGLVPGALGRVQPNQTSPYGTEISTKPGTNRSGVLWTTPTVLLPPGAYTVRMIAAPLGVNTSAPHAHLIVRAEGFGAPTENWTVLPAELPPGAWTTVSLNFSTDAPIPNFELMGSLGAPMFGLGVAEVSIAPNAVSA
jgi:uncharacterized membrane protein